MYWAWNKQQGSTTVILCVCVSCSVVSYSLRPHGPQLFRLLCPRDFPQARILEGVAISFSRGSSHPVIESGLPALLANSLLSEPPGKPVCIHIYVYVSINGEIVYGIFALETLLFQKNAKVIYMHIHTCKHKLKTRRGSLSSNLSSENFYWIYN